MNFAYYGKREQLFEARGKIQKQKIFLASADIKRVSDILYSRDHLRNKSRIKRFFSRLYRALLIGIKISCLKT